jgi:hypothetical protein
MNVFFEIIGYLGTALVLLSMAMTTMTRLRIVNLAGSVMSMIYALTAAAHPVVLLNAGLIIINAIQLVRAHAANDASK